MFEFKFEPEIPLLTVTRTGRWTFDTVRLYEAALRRELEKLHNSGRPNAAIIDIRASGAQSKDVADALRSMVGRLGPLNADRVAVVTSSGIAKLQAKQTNDVNTEVFTSIVLARDWVRINAGFVNVAGTVHDEPIDAEAQGLVVHLRGPADVDLTLTPAAALETAKRIGDAAIDVLVATGIPTPRRGKPSTQIV